MVGKIPKIGAQQLGEYSSWLCFKQLVLPLDCTTYSMLNLRNVFYRALIFLIPLCYKVEKLCTTWFRDFQPPNTLIRNSTRILLSRTPGNSFQTELKASISAIQTENTFCK